MTLPTSDTTTQEQDTITIVSEDTKVCADCSHLLGVRYKTDEITKWRCGHSNNVYPHDSKEGWKVDLVSGLKHRIFKMSADIRMIREQACKGDWYEKYVPPVRTEYPIEKPEPRIGGKIAIELATEEVFDKDSLASNATAAAARIAALKARKK